MSKQIQEHTKDPLEGRIVFLLILTVLVQFMYPLSIGGTANLIGFQLFYMSLFASGIYLISQNRRQMFMLIGLCMTWVAVGALYALRPDWWVASLLSYSVLIIFQVQLTFVLLRYIFRAREVNRDVLLAACTVYLMIGGIFVSVFGIIETLTWFPTGEHAFVDGSNVNPIVNKKGEELPFPWQTTVYYSYSTLTTLGYGDVLPVTNWSRSAATLEAVIGVLYTGIIVARLVGLYATKEIEDDLEEIGVIP